LGKFCWLERREGGSASPKTMPKGSPKTQNIRRQGRNLPANALRTTRFPGSPIAATPILRDPPMTCDVGPTDEAEEWGEVSVAD
jgi:hypothetical protein